jgi:ubiquinone/menaquinone biosynthesis C-methylase UbiE
MMEQEKELKSIQHFTKLSYEMLEISTGDSVIEVGCGTGDDAVKFYNIVGPSGRLWELITANK